MFNPAALVREVPTTLCPFRYLSPKLWGLPIQKKKNKEQKKAFS